MLTCALGYFHSATNSARKFAIVYSEARGCPPSGAGNMLESTTLIVWKPFTRKLVSSTVSTAQVWAMWNCGSPTTRIRSSIYLSLLSLLSTVKGSSSGAGPTMVFNSPECSPIMEIIKSPNKLEYSNHLRYWIIFSFLVAFGYSKPYIVGLRSGLLDTLEPSSISTQSLSISVPARHYSNRCELHELTSLGLLQWKSRTWLLYGEYWVM